ncbi:MAG TPA: hypothetical protein PK033_07570 [Acetivibrio sp.]|nr:hypothetical protein [Clostridium sp.]HOQ37507.1 hypothetical protein [Acetivibrio sp.]HQA57721.1 hypothetical protein [Acetivibrio sp.]
MIWGIFFIFIFLLWISIRTFSYGKWTWDKKNWLGAIMVFVIAALILILPMLSFYWAER